MDEMASQFDVQMFGSWRIPRLALNWARHHAVIADGVKRGLLATPDRSSTCKSWLYPPAQLFSKEIAVMLAS
ncbi:MAG: hypothetical protein DMG89_26340 [Acidobacteria bacterium]|nr:MAG: hypothetical protein DMG89_26340 [Acidobacteriota bacterium]